MTRRITVPEDHVALVIPARLADEALALMQIIRRAGKHLNFEFDAEGNSVTKAIANDLVLALLDAKEG